MRSRTRALVIAAMAGSLVALGAMAAPAAMAHPLGNFTVNRYSGLVVAPGRVEVRYVLDMAEIPTFQTAPAIDTDGDGTQSDAERAAWAAREAAAIAGRADLRVNGVAVPLAVASSTMSDRPGQAGLPTLRLEAVLAGRVDATSGSLRYEDRNFAGRIGWREITARAAQGVALADASVPASSASRELTAYPVDLLASPLDETVATARFAPGTGSNTPAATTATGATVGGAPIASGGAFAALVTWRLTPFVLVLSLFAAFGFGAVHALGPGHGKTITAAYLVGRGARVRDSAAAGAAVALMHTASVLALGLVLFLVARTFPAERVYPWLTLATGAVALGLGVVLLVARVRAHRRGESAWHGHSHSRGHAHREGHDLHEHEDEVHHHHGADRRPLSARGLAALAVAGGILPSPTAFVVLTGAVSAHRVGYGLALVAAFSLGLAASLMGVGLVALRARSAVSRRLSSRRAQLIPIVSAAVIVGFGVFFAAQGIHALTI